MVEYSTMDTWWPVAAEGDIEQGKMRAFTLEGREIVVCHSREGWFALDDVCSHAYARMSEGRLRGCRLICPLHGASFDVRDGMVLGAPAVAPLKTHALRIVDGQVEVALRP
jgi:3-phenylpropionate/trans-cinnamate dioxygenase ferredoxin subunit